MKNSYVYLLVVVLGVGCGRVDEKNYWPNCLSFNINYSTVNGHIEDHTDNSDYTIHFDINNKPICKCGKCFTKVDSQSNITYSNDVLIANIGRKCDKCDNRIQDGNSYWHCKSFSFRHLLGFDLCNDCSSKSKQYDYAEVNQTKTVVANYNNVSS